MDHKSIASEAVALLSIHPRHAESILSGRKRIEFRRVPFRRKLSHAMIYATAPVSAVVGCFSIEQVHQGSPAEVWRRFGHLGRISQSEFIDYYTGTAVAVAIEVGRTQSFSRPWALSELGTTRPPQSFAYLTATVLQRPQVEQALDRALP